LNFPLVQPFVFFFLVLGILPDRLFIPARDMARGRGDSKRLFLVKHLVETTQNLLLGTVETKKSRKVLRPLLGAAIQATTFGDGC
jgi:hypothetical protein